MASLAARARDRPLHRLDARRVLLDPPADEQQVAARGRLRARSAPADRRTRRGRPSRGRPRRPRREKPSPVAQLPRSPPLGDSEAGRPSAPAACEIMTARAALHQRVGTARDPAPPRAGSAGTTGSDLCVSSAARPRPGKCLRQPPTPWLVQAVEKRPRRRDDRVGARRRRCAPRGPALPAPGNGAVHDGRQIHVEAETREHRPDGGAGAPGRARAPRPL